jgi:hypothetical protein
VAAFTDGNGVTGNLGTQISGIYLQAGSTPGTFNVGLGQNRGTITWNSTDYAAGTTLFLVANFISGSPDTTDLWVDPALGLSSAPTPTIALTSGETGGFGDNKVDSFALQTDGGIPNAGVVADEVRVGTTFGDVDPTAVPEPASLGVITMGAGLLMRRRRK